MTTTALPARAALNELRDRKAKDRLVRLANYAFGEGFLPEVAAIAAGYPTRQTAIQAAQYAGRPHLADALRPPSTDERRAAQEEDINFLLDHGEDTDRAAFRCGLSNTGNAKRMFREWGMESTHDRLSALEYRPSEEWDDAA